MGYMVILLGWLVTIIASLRLLYQIFQGSRSSKLKLLPPGPTPIPVLGNLHMFVSKPMSEVFKDLIPKFGPVMTFWIGSTPLVVLTSVEHIRTVHIDQGGKLLNRPRFSSNQMSIHNSRGPASSSGNRWQFLRKFMMTEVLSNARVASFRPIRTLRVDTLIEKLRQKVREDENAIISVKTEIRYELLNIVVGMIFGQYLEVEKLKELEKVTAAKVKLAAGQPKDHIKLLRHVPDPGIASLQVQTQHRAREVMLPMVLERQKVLASGVKDPVPIKPIIDTVIGFQSEKIVQNGQTLDFTDDDMLNIAAEIMATGTDTTTLTLEWAIAELIAHPKLQDKLASEIDEVVGKTRDLNEDDIPNLPYLNAVIKETLRRHSPAQLSPARDVSSTIFVAGYEIPVKAMVICHLGAIQMNPEVWANPSVYDPDRFMSQGMQLDQAAPNLLGNMLPFLVGRRMCPASNLAFLQLNLVLGRLIQSFEWKSATPGTIAPDLTCQFRGFVAPLNTPLTATLRERPVARK